MSYSQYDDVLLSKSISDFQIGFLGTWVNHEIRTSNKSTLKIELGLESGFYGGFSTKNVNYFMTPSITIEPRFYYNLKKRKNELRDVSSNSANFFSFKISLKPNWFIISNDVNIKINNQINIIPTWGIRRKISNHLIFETGIGIGYQHIFTKNTSKNNKAVINIHLRFGFTL